MALFLQRNELKELTGYSRPSAQRRWLYSHNYPYEIAGDGYPRVLLECVTRRLGVNSAPSLPKAIKPNFAAIL